MAVDISNINQAIIDKITSINFGNIIGWLFFFIIVIGAGFWFILWFKNKKQFNKNIIVKEINGDYWEETYKDFAKNVKLGKGGFVILYLKKLKTWKIAYGGRTGRNNYTFYIMPDGYWHNARESANIDYIDDKKGLIPVITTNPAMRSQYTSLEKQIDSLGDQKKGFWEQYGSWVLSIAFIVIAGVMLWLNYQQYASAASSFGQAIEKMDSILGKLGNLASNIQSAGQESGLVPAVIGFIGRRL